MYDECGGIPIFSTIIKYDLYKSINGLSTYSRNNFTDIAKILCEEQPPKICQAVPVPVNPHIDTSKYPIICFMDFIDIQYRKFL
jgi:hypothetical protein